MQYQRKHEYNLSLIKIEFLTKTEFFNYFKP